MGTVRIRHHRSASKGNRSLLAAIPGKIVPNSHQYGAYLWRELFQRPCRSFGHVETCLRGQQAQCSRARPLTAAQRSNRVRGTNRLASTPTRTSQVAVGLWTRLMIATLTMKGTFQRLFLFRYPWGRKMAVGRSITGRDLAQGGWRNGAGVRKVQQPPFSLTNPRRDRHV